MNRPSCRVWLNGSEISEIYETAVCMQRIWTPNPKLTTTPVAIATQDGLCRVEIERLNGPIESVTVRPMHLGIVPEIREGRALFTLDRPTNVTVEFNDTVEGALHLFLHKRNNDKPKKDAPGVRWFGPGIHREDIIEVHSGETIYLDDGCLLYGQICCQDCAGFTIAGHGVICGSIYDRWKDTLVPVNLTRCRDFTVRDITILDPSAWTLNLLDCENGKIEGVKIVSARSNSDGLTFQNCRNIRASGCFVRSWDDNLVVKGYDGDVNGIAFIDCTLWTDLAQSCEVGYETRAKSIRNILFRDITILHNFHKPVMSIHNSDNAAIRNVRFENITVEDARMGEGDGTDYLIDLTTTASDWSRTPDRGTTGDVTFQNIQVLSGKRPAIRIYANDATSWIDHVYIENLSILGKRITDFGELDYESSPFNGSDIRIK